MDACTEQKLEKNTASQFRPKYITSHRSAFVAWYPCTSKYDISYAFTWNQGTCLSFVSAACVCVCFFFFLSQAQRLVFDQSSPNGILLFRECSKIAVAFGTRLVQVRSLSLTVVVVPPRKICLFYGTMTTWGKRQTYGCVVKFE